MTYLKLTPAQASDLMQILAKAKKLAELSPTLAASAGLDASDLKKLNTILNKAER